jgi:hypothetical protein
MNENQELNQELECIEKAIRDYRAGKLNLPDLLDTIQDAIYKLELLIDD